MAYRALPAVVAGVLCAGTPLAAQSFGRYPGDHRAGPFVFLDAALVTPTDLDQVVAYEIAAGADPQTSSTVAPAWGWTLAGRIGGGWRFASGARLAAGYWRFDDATSVSADGPSGGLMRFAIGPPVVDDGTLAGSLGTPGSAQFEVSTVAELFDLDFGQESPIHEHLTMEWLIGLRYAAFEETYDGSYDLCASTGCSEAVDYAPGEIAYDAVKRNESSMFGLRAAVRARFKWTEDFRVAGGAALSLLTGTIEGSSGLTPAGALNASEPGTLLRLVEDRSGMIAEIDVGLEWEVVRDSLRLTAGWELARWDGVPYDVVRNPSGSLTPNRDRDTVSFSGPRVGLGFRF